MHVRDLNPVNFDITKKEKMQQSETISFSKLKDSFRSENENSQWVEKQGKLFVDRISFIFHCFI